VTSLVDITLVVLMLIFAVNGYRQGFLVGLLSFIGFFGGALLGLQIGPLIGQQFQADSARVLVSLAAIFGLAVAGQALAGFVGTRLRNAIRNQAAQRFDDLGGAVVSVFALLLVVWLVAAPLGSSSLPWLASSIRNSAILRTIDRIMPDEARALSKALRDTVDTNGFPDVFGGLVPTQVRPVDPPDPKVANSQAVVTARKSVVKVLGTAPSCSRRIEGSGFVYAPEHVMTNAHVVAGTKDPLTVNLGGVKRDGHVVAFDPKRDLAVIYVPGLAAPAMAFATKDAPSEADAVVIGFPLDGPFNAQPARVRDVRNITGPDIYDSGQVRREIYTIRSLVLSGNSGGPLVSLDGAVLGVIFAAAADDRNTGFAITADEAAGVAQDGRTRTAATSTGACA
jgi:S1-C subfamily serine protease